MVVGIPKACLDLCRKQGWSIEECESKCSLSYEAAAQYGINGIVREAGKDLLAQQEKDILVRSVKKVKEVYHGCSASAQGGHVAEDWHKATYNVDAIHKGVSERAGSTHYHSSADLVVGDKEVQIKMGESHNLKKLNKAVYDGMQKVVPEGLSHNEKGWSDRIRLGKAESKPLSNEAMKKLLQNPEEFVDKAMPSDSMAISALKSGTSGAFAGGLLASTISCGYCMLVGADRKTTMEQAKESALQGAVTGGASSAAANVVTQATGEAALGALGGGIVAGVATTGFQMQRCTRKFEDEEEREKCRDKELKFGTAAAVTGASATFLCSMLIGPFGPLCGIAAAAGVRSQK